MNNLALLVAFGVIVTVFSHELFQPQTAPTAEQTECNSIEAAEASVKTCSNIKMGKQSIQKCCFVSYVDEKYGTGERQFCRPIEFTEFGIKVYKHSLGVFKKVKILCDAVKVDIALFYLILCTILVIM